MTPELAGLYIVVLVLVVVLATFYGRARNKPPGPDVGVDIVDWPTEAEEKAMYDEYFPGACGVCDGCINCNCDGCNECGAPMLDDEPTQLTEYGGAMVHRLCLDARRDGRVPCASCAPVMAGRAA